MLLAIALLHRHMHTATLNVLLFSALPLACVLQLARTPFPGVVPALLLVALCVESGVVALRGRSSSAEFAPAAALPVTVGADDRT